MLIRDKVLYPRRDFRGRIIHDSKTCALKPQWRCESCNHSAMPKGRPPALRWDDDLKPLNLPPAISPDDLAATLRHPHYRPIFETLVFDLIAAQVGELVGELIAEGVKS